MQCAWCKRDVPASVVVQVLEDDAVARCTQCGTTVTRGGLLAALGVGDVDLAAARGGLLAKLDDGTKCPCCDQWAKRYQRKMSSIIARWLIAFYKVDPDLLVDGKWCHVSDAARLMPKGGASARSGDYGKARFWDLIEEAGPDLSVAGQKSSGLWRLKERGRAFVERRHFVPMYADVYNNECTRLHGDPMDITAALGEHFNYDELMGGQR